MIWVIVLKVTLINMAAPELMSNIAFPTQDSCMMAIAGEPLSDRVVCRPMQLVKIKQDKNDKPQGDTF